MYVLIVRWFKYMIDRHDLAREASVSTTTWLGVLGMGATKRQY